MKKKRVLIAAIIFITISCNVSKKVPFNPEKKYSPSQLQEDFSLLRKILTTNHPSLYWYTSQDSINLIFSNTKALLHDSLTEQEFKNRVAFAISKIRCGHTSVRSSKRFNNFISKQPTSQFPLLLKVWRDSAVVVTNLFKTDTTLKRGTIITAINQHSIKQILDSICQFISADGYSNNFKFQLISFNFPAYFKSVFGADSSYAVNYIDLNDGLQKKINLKNYLSISRQPSEQQQFGPNPAKKRHSKNLKFQNDRTIQIDSSLNTAFLSVNTFSHGKLKKFFKRSFREIREKQVKNVVIDLRLNSGGDVLTCAKLSQYLIEKPFRIADTVAAFTRRFYYKKYIKPWFIYWVSMNFSGRIYADKRVHFKYFEKHYFKPIKRDHFDGKVYLLTGGYTFSAASLVTETLKGQCNITIVGEETGGGAYGNSAIFLPEIVLPNTKIRVTLPLYRMVLNANHPKDGRGVLPDTEVTPSSLSIKSGMDGKLEKVKELITRDNAEISNH